MAHVTYSDSNSHLSDSRRGVDRVEESLGGRALGEHHVELGLEGRHHGRQLVLGGHLELLCLRHSLTKHNESSVI